MFIEKIKYCIKELALFLLLLIAGSCSDDTVKPPVADFDLPRFNWRIVEIPGNPSGYSGLWAKDTSKVFLANHSAFALLITTSGQTVSHAVGNYGLTDIDGISNNEVYIYGASAFPNSELTIIKWNGASFEYIKTGITVNAEEGIKGLSVSSNEVWISSRNGICKFDGANIISYNHEDLALIPVDIFLSNTNKVQYIAEKETINLIQTCLYEFRDTGFVKIFDYQRNPNTTLSYTFLRVVGKDKYGLQLNKPASNPWSVCIENFSGSSFNPYFCLNKVSTTIISRANNPTGNNMQDFIGLVEVSEFGIFTNTRLGVLHWNGVKTSKEFELTHNSAFPYDTDLSFVIDQNNYLILEPALPNPPHAALYFGSRK